MIVDYTQISMKMTEKSIDATPLKPVEVFKILTILSSRLPSLNLSHIETVKIEDSLWPVMMSLTERLYCIKSKERYAIPETTMTVEDILQRYPTTMQLDTPSREDMQTKDGPFAQLRFPMELLATIFGFLSKQKDLYQCTRVCHRWNEASIFLLYRTPQLTSIKSIDLFLFTVETSRAFYLNPQDAPRPRWPYHTLVRRILFGISMQGSLASLFDATPGCEEIIRSHSSLFRLFVWERSERSWTAAHPAVVRIVKACDNLEFMSEEIRKAKSRSSMRASNSSTPGQFEESGSQTPSSPPIFSGGGATSIPQRAADLLNTGTDVLLKTLVMSTQRVVSFSRWCGIQPTRLLNVGIFLLELLDQPEGSFFWTGVPKETVTLAKNCTMDKYKRILNALSTVILTEVQYITASSQRLLNAYCMVYYRTLSHAHSLNLTIVLKSLRHAANELYESGIAETDSRYFSGNFIPATPAGRILQALQIIFHQNILPQPAIATLPRAQRMSLPITPTDPSLPTISVSSPTDPGVVAFGVPEAETAPSLSSEPHLDSRTHADTILGGILSSRTSLRDALTSFTPGTINEETSELVERLVDITDDLDRDLSGATRRDDIDGFLETVEMTKCVRWLKEVIRWQRAGRQMEPVKDLLRKSMAKIDYLRSVQRRHGVQFMD